MSTPPATHQADEHDRRWNDLLLDWLDGELSPADRARFETHLNDCAICRTLETELAQLDGALAAALPRLTLDATFDEHLLKQINTIDESQRVHARERLEQELRATQRALARRWRRSLAFVIPGVVAGIALACALAAWFDNSSLSRVLIVAGTNEFGRQAADYLQLLAMTVIDGAIGLVVARWLAAE